MNILNYIGEFFLFRWIFGRHKRNEAKYNKSVISRNNADKDFVDDIDSQRDFGMHYENLDYTDSQWHEDFHDEQDDYDIMLDDFDEEPEDYGMMADDFEDELEDYDMMLDDFEDEPEEFLEDFPNFKEDFPDMQDYDDMMDDDF